MRGRLYILGFYFTAAIASILLGTKIFHFDVGLGFWSILISIHFTMQVINLRQYEALSKLIAGLIILLIFVGLFSLQLFTSFSVPSVFRIYLIILLFSRNYLHNTATYPIRMARFNIIILFTILIGILLKIMHYPGGDAFFISGHIGLAILLVRIGYYKAKTAIQVTDEIDKIGIE